MTKNSISQFSTAAASNTDIAGININTGWPGANVGQAFRELMAMLAQQNTGVEPWNSLLIENASGTTGSWLLNTDTSTPANLVLSQLNSGGTVIATPLSVSGSGGALLAGGGIDISGYDANGANLRVIGGTGTAAVGSILRNDGTNFYMLMTAAGSPSGTWTTARPLEINVNTGAVTIDGTGLGTAIGGTTGTLAAANVNASGAVNVGGTLAVTGAVTASGSLQVAGGLTVSGATSLAVATATTPAANDTSTRVATTAFANPGALLGGSGYQKLPSGLNLQWGLAASSTTGSGSTNSVGVTFSEAFPTGCVAVFVSFTAAQGGCSCSAAGFSTTGCTVSYANLSGITQTLQAFYFAIGY